MKHLTKRSVFILGILLLMQVFTSCGHMYEIVIPDEKGVLIFPKNADYTYAAEFLHKYIRLSTGDSIAIVTESNASPDKIKISLLTDKNI